MRTTVNTIDARLQFNRPTFDMRGMPLRAPSMEALGVTWYVVLATTR